MIRAFDYCFYRIHSAFKNFGDSIADTTAAGLLTLAQGMTIFDIVIIAQFQFDFTLPSSRFNYVPLLCYS